MNKLIGFIHDIIYKIYGDPGGRFEDKQGGKFSECVYVFRFPNGKKYFYDQVDYENLPKGTFVAEYRFVHGQEIYEEQ